MTLSIIVPVYNEEDTIKKVIKDILNVSLPGGLKREIIIIDDHSDDKTMKILNQYHRHPDIKVFRQRCNLGKTAAVKRGIKESKGEIILIQDADLEYSPEHYPRLLEPILKDKSYIVYGSRFKGRIQGMTWINKLANQISNLTINILYRAHISDFHTGFKVFRRDVLNHISIDSKNFSFDTEITVKFLRKGFTILEVPIHYTARDKKEGKKITWALALETYSLLLKSKFWKDSISD